MIFRVHRVVQALFTFFPLVCLSLYATDLQAESVEITADKFPKTYQWLQEFKQQYPVKDYSGHDFYSRNQGFGTLSNQTFINSSFINRLEGYEAIQNPKNRCKYHYQDMSFLRKLIEEWKDFCDGIAMDKYQKLYGQYCVYDVKRMGDGIMLHEMGHIENGDCLKKGLLELGAKVGALFVGLSDAKKTYKTLDRFKFKPIAKSFGKRCIPAYLLTTVFTSAYSRYCERRADDFACKHASLETLYGFKSFLEDINTDVGGIISTHPSDASRVEKFEKEIQKRIDQESKDSAGDITTVRLYGTQYSPEFKLVAAGIGASAVCALGKIVYDWWNKEDPKVVEQRRIAQKIQNILDSFKPKQMKICCTFLKRQIENEEFSSILDSYLNKELSEKYQISHEDAQQLIKHIFESGSFFIRLNQKAVASLMLATMEFEDEQDRQVVVDKVLSKGQV